MTEGFSPWPQVVFWPDSLTSLTCEQAIAFRKNGNQIFGGVNHWKWRRWNWKVICWALLVNAQGINLLIIWSKKGSPIPADPLWVLLYRTRPFLHYTDVVRQVLSYWRLEVGLWPMGLVLLLVTDRLHEPELARLNRTDPLRRYIVLIFEHFDYMATGLVRFAGIPVAALLRLLGRWSM